MPSIVQRYTLKEIISPTLLGLLVFTFILLTAELYDLVELLVNRGVSPLKLLRMLGYLLPNLLALTIPMALLVGVLMGFGRMTNENEIMAMRTSGINLMKICWPPIGLSALICGLLIVLNFNVIPNMFRQMQDLLHEIAFDVTTNLQAGRAEEMPAEKGNDLNFYYRQRHPENPELMQAVALMIRANPSEAGGRRKKVFITAETGQVKVVEKPGDTAGAPPQRQLEIHLFDGQAISLDSESQGSPQDTQVMDFDRMVYVQPPKPRVKRKREEMTIAELYFRSRDQSVRQRDRGEYTVELYWRMTVPLACLSFVVFGIPLAILIRPRGKAMSYGFTIGLIFFYYIVLNIGKSLGQENGLLAGMVVLSPNVILIAFGAYMLRRTVRS